MGSHIAGPDVVRLQRKLKELGYLNTRADGIFGKVAKRPYRNKKPITALNPVELLINGCWKCSASKTTLPEKFKSNRLVMARTLKSFRVLAIIFWITVLGERSSSAQLEIVVFEQCLQLVNANVLLTMLFGRFK